MTDRPARVAGVVPCAGESSRMGVSKALLDAGGRSFLAAVVGALRGGGCDPIVVITRQGAAAEVRKAREVGAEPLENPDPGEGPITSLRLALMVLRGTVDAVAYCPIDHPLVQAETVARLLEEHARGDAPLVVPTHGGQRGHPVVFGAGLFGELLDRGLEGGARTVVHRHLTEARLVEVDDPGVLTDIDTPEAYREAFG